LEILIFGYIIFAIATAVTANIFIVKPVITYLCSLDPLPLFVALNSKKLIYFAFFITGFIFAPILVFNIFSKTRAEKLINQMQQSLQKD
jgi:hypothetical protein